MAKRNVTTGLIEKYLDRHGWTRHVTLDEPGEVEGIVTSGWRPVGAADGHVLAIDPMKEKATLAFSVEELAVAPTDATPVDRLSGLLLALSANNARLDLGAFVYDPGNGELAFRLGLPIDSDDLHYEDFAHCVRAVTTTVDRYVEPLRGIIDGTCSATDVIR